MGYIGMGNMNKAVLLAEESVALDRKTGDMTHLAISLAFLGLCTRYWENGTRANNTTRKLRAYPKDKRVANNLCRNWAHGWLYLEKGEHVKAENSLRKPVKSLKK